MPKFEIKEIAIAVNGTAKGTPNHPMECEIMEFLPEGVGCLIYGISYRAHVPGYHSGTDTGFWEILESDLRKIKPPEMGSLDELEKITQWGDKPGYRPKPIRIPVHKFGPNKISVSIIRHTPIHNVNCKFTIKFKQEKN